MWWGVWFSVDEGFSEADEGDFLERVGVEAYEIRWLDQLPRAVLGGGLAVGELDFLAPYVAKAPPEVEFIVGRVRWDLEEDMGRR